MSVCECQCLLNVIKSLISAGGNCQEVVNVNR